MTSIAMFSRCTGWIFTRRRQQQGQAGRHFLSREPVVGLVVTDVQAALLPQERAGDQKPENENPDILRHEWQGAAAGFR